MAEFTFRITPRASREAIEATQDGTWKLYVRSAPVDGEANDAAVNLIAKTLRIAPGRIALIRGQKSRIKTVTIEGLSDEELIGRLSL